MSEYTFVPVTPKTIKWLTAAQSVLSALITLAAAGAFADVVGASNAGFLLALSAALQAGIGAFLARAVGRTVEAAAGAVADAARVSHDAAETSREATDALRAEHGRGPGSALR